MASSGGGPSPAARQVRLQLEQREGRVESLMRVVFFAAGIIGILSMLPSLFPSIFGTSIMLPSFFGMGTSFPGMVPDSGDHRIIGESYGIDATNLYRRSSMQEGIGNYNRKSAPSSYNVGASYSYNSHSNYDSFAGGHDDIDGGSSSSRDFPARRYYPQQGNTLFAVNPSVVFILVSLCLLIWFCFNPSSQHGSSQHGASASPATTPVLRQSGFFDKILDSLGLSGLVQIVMGGKGVGIFQPPTHSTAHNAGNNIGGGIFGTPMVVPTDQNDVAAREARFGTIMQRSLFGTTQGNNLVELAPGETSRPGIAAGGGAGAIVPTKDDHGEAVVDQGIEEVRSRYPTLQKPLASKTPLLEDEQVRTLFPAAARISAGLYEMIHKSVIPPLLLQLAESDDTWSQALQRLNLSLSFECLSARGFDRQNNTVVSVFDRNLPVEVTSRDASAVTLWKRRQELELFLLHPGFEAGQCRTYIYNRLLLYFQTGSNFLLGNSYGTAVLDTRRGSASSIGGLFGGSSMSSSAGISSMTSNVKNLMGIGASNSSTSSMGGASNNLFGNPAPENYVDIETGLTDFHILENLLLKFFETHISHFSSTYLAHAGTTGTIGGSLGSGMPGMGGGGNMNISTAMGTQFGPGMSSTGHTGAGTGHTGLMGPSSSNVLLRSLNNYNSTGGARKWIGYEVLSREGSWRVWNVLDAFALFLLLKRDSRDFALFPLPLTNLVHAAAQ